jgi:hypothetical protein
MAGFIALIRRDLIAGVLFIPYFGHISCAFNGYCYSCRNTEDSLHNRSKTMKHSILITTGMIAGLLFASSGAIAGPQGDSQKIYPQKHSVSKTANKKAGKNQLNIRGVNVAQIESRIQNGIKRGKLTPAETRTAKRGLNSLKATIKVVKSDRRVTKWEQERVQKKSAQLTRQINQLINNRVVVKNNKPSRRIAHR